MKRQLKPPAILVAILFLTVNFAPAKTAPKAKAIQEQSWKEYAYPIDGFAITLPDAPNPHKDTQLPDGTAYTVHLPGEHYVTLHVRKLLRRVLRSAQRIRELNQGSRVQVLHRTTIRARCHHCWAPSGGV